MSPAAITLSLLWIVGGLIAFALVPRRNEPSIHSPSNAERLAAWERRLGAHRARKRMQAERVYRLIDQRSARRIVAMARTLKQENAS